MSYHTGPKNASGVGSWLQKLDAIVRQMPGKLEGMPRNFVQFWRLANHPGSHIGRSPTIRGAILEAMPQKFPAAPHILPAILEAPPAIGNPN